MALTVDRSNLACGAIFIGFGLFFGTQSLGLDLGTATDMGSGYFPLILACVLIMLGAVVVGLSLRTKSEPVGAIAWRGMLLILPAPSCSD
ncbi:hypothetical protein SAMN04488498_10417 [Mesorhizobium albiziae]|uniref:Tripartite tricarboxylate transporter TctB family protein n=1 Tax=Neomesorhizobium albiziae TaxID=335020 RepID=A0A1I3XYC8_9HYPH|nr:hypothetical protein SAMN04488498_10417 [Mesorhizobium albiziae]